jgi:anti-sigma factor RsiW
VAALTDEILMAFADGALDAGTAAQIAAHLKTDAQARARVAMFRATGRTAFAPYDRIVQEPVPAHLIEFVMSYEPGQKPSPAPETLAFAAPSSGWAPAPSRRPHRPRLWAALRERLIPQGAGWQLAAASGAALIVGASAGFLLRGEGQDGGQGPNLMVMREGQILASGALHQVLETVPSNEERGEGSTQETAPVQEVLTFRPKEDSTQGAMAVVRAVLTYRTKEGGYCREYEMVVPQGQFQGVACRNADGHWALQAHVAQETAAAGMQVVGHGEVMDKIAESRMEGDAFGKSEEKAAIKRGWK